jgi:hypothetical protein
MTRSWSWRTVEVGVLVVASFSPLLPTSLMVALTALVAVLNLGYARQVNRDSVLILIAFLGAFAVGLVYDLGSVASIGQMSPLNLYFPLCFVLGFLIGQKYRLDEYLCHLERVVFFAAMFSLVGVCVYTFLPEVVFRLPAYSFYHTSHRTALVFNVLVHDTVVVPRNAGIAWEPGAFQLLLNLGVYSHIRFSRKASLARIAVYLLAIVFTRSTAAMIIMIFIVFDAAKRLKTARWLLVVLIIAFSGAIGRELAYQYVNKLSGSAFASRLEPMLNAYRAGWNRPLGLGNSTYDQCYEALGIGAWDSYAQIFIRYGYGLFLLILLLLARLARNHLTLFAILSITFASQTIWFFPLITPFCFISTETSRGVGARGASP